MLCRLNSLLALSAVSLIAVTFPGTSRGQGLLVNDQPGQQVRLPRPWIRPPQPAPGSYKVESIDIDASLKDQVATVQIAQKFRNTGSQQMEATFVFPLPYDAAIDRLTLLVDGKEFAANLLPAEEARQLYESIVRKNQDPALLEWVGSGLFRTSVFPLPAGAERTVTLRYTQICRKSEGLTDILFPLKGAKYTSEPVDKLTIRVAIDSQEPISNVYSPSTQVKIERPSPRRAIVTHESTKALPAEDFRLLFDSPTKGLGASLVSYRPNPQEPGFFMMMASPQMPDELGEPAPKTMLFVVDRSGSMSGKKIQQARGALRFVLNNLREGDTFNIIAYDTTVQAFRPELQKVTAESREAALAFVDGLAAGGSTNIDGALTRALSMLKDDSRPNYVMFLTDGLPTAGDTKEASIVEHSRTNNSVRARVFAFGVGYDVNSRLLDKLARTNFGQTEYVRPDQDIEASVARLYNRVESPVLTGVQLAIDVDTASPGGDGISWVYPSGTFDLFSGEQLVLVGRYGKPGAAKVTLSGKIGSVGRDESFEFRATLSEKSEDSTNAFVGRLWATRRVGDIIDQIDLNGKNDELINELVSLATHHGIVTQYTSFLADEAADHNAVASNRGAARVESEALGVAGGRFGFSQRKSKQALQQSAAPAAAKSRAFYAELGDLDSRWGVAELNGIMLGCPTYFDGRRGQACIATNIRQIGDKTFFMRRDPAGNAQWCDSSVNEEEEKQANAIKRFSDDYFALVAKHGQEIAPYLAVDEPVVVRIGKEVYRW